MNLRIVATGIAVMGCLSGLAGADPKKQGSAKGKPAEDPHMAEMMKMAAPGPAHMKLKAMVGKWALHSKMWMNGPAKPMESDATGEVKSIMGDRFFVEDVSGTMMGQPWSGMGVFGYNNRSQKYEWTWIDAAGTEMMHLTGTADATGKTITTTGEGYNPMLNKVSPVRFVRHIDSDAKNTLEMFMAGPDGKDFRMMEIVYTRK
jgi:hypothetical protein